VYDNFDAVDNSKSHHDGLIGAEDFQAYFGVKNDNA
jgi:hypothetical protein